MSQVKLIQIIMYNLQYTTDQNVPPPTPGLSVLNVTNQTVKPHYSQIQFNLLRESHVSNFIFTHNNLNSYRYKHIALAEIPCNNLSDLMIYSETKPDESFLQKVFIIDRYNMYIGRTTLKKRRFIIPYAFRYSAWPITPF